MRYCVIKNTTIVIDGSNNSTEIMLINANNAGFTELEVEILTEEEYQERLESEPMPPETPTDAERIDMLENMILLMMMEGK